MKKVKWLGSDKCDICGSDVRKNKFFFDAKTKKGQWALMCGTCFVLVGMGRLGTGFGQEYDSTTFEKVSG